MHGEEKYYRPIVSCNPVYDSAENALEDGTALMSAVKNLDLSLQRKTLFDKLGGEETAKTVDPIVLASRA